VKQKDFDGQVDVIPVADPNIYSLSQRVTLASENLKIAMSNPSMHNLRESYRRVYAALGTRDIDKVLKPEPPIVPKDPAIENMEALQMKLPKAFPEQDHQAHIASHTTFMATRMVQVNPMVYALLQGHVSEHVSLQAQGEVGAMIDASPELKQQLQQDPEGAQVKIDAMIAQRCAELTAKLVQQEQMGKQKDPLVALKERELDLKAMDMQRKATESAQDMQMQDSQFEESTDVDKMKLEDNEDQAKERIRIADEKMAQNEMLTRAKMDMTRDIAGAKLGVEKMKRTAEDKRTQAMKRKK